jgi:hypothetical protein
MNQNSTNNSIFPRNFHLEEIHLPKSRSNILYKNIFDANLISETSSSRFPETLTATKSKYNEAPKKVNNFLSKPFQSSKITKPEKPKTYKDRLKQLGLFSEKNIEKFIYQKQKRTNTFEYKTDQLFKEQNTFAKRLKNLNIYSNNETKKVDKFLSNSYKPKKTYAEKMKKLQELNDLL